jgi:hypothetical protein
VSLLREKEIQTLLQRALNFTREDLKTNRTGVMTDAQSQALQQELFWTVIGYVVIGALVALLLSRSLMGLLAAVYIVPIIFMVIGGSLWSSYRLKRAIEKNEIESVTGIVRRSIEFDRTYRRRRRRIKARYQILIADEIFEVDKSVHDAFVESETYTIYYIPSLERVISGEMASTSDSIPQRKLKYRPSSYRTIGL